MEALSPKKQGTDPVATLQELLHQNIQIQGTHLEMESGPDGIYLSSELPLESHELKFKDITELPMAQLGATDSQHEVAFAAIELEDSNRELDVIPMAVKRFDEASRDGAILEFNSLVAVGQKGLDALKPLALVKDGQEAYMLTGYRPDITSLDNERWDAAPGEQDFEAVCENLAFIADSMGAMHANGIFSGDAQPKNFVRSDTGKPVIIDLEAGSGVYETGSDEHIHAFNRRGNATDASATQDLKQFWLLLGYPIGLRDDNVFLGKNATLEDCKKVFEKHFIKPYIQSLGRNCTGEMLMKMDVVTVIEALQEKVDTDTQPMPLGK